MKKFFVLLLGAMFFSELSYAQNCQEQGYNLRADGSHRIPTICHQDDNKCIVCREGGVEYFKIVNGTENAEKSEETRKAAQKEDVNCMDFLKAGDEEGFVKCSGLPGTWKLRGNQLMRIK